MASAEVVVKRLRDEAELTNLEIKSMLTYFGQSQASSENEKPEDFFALFTSFASALQVWAYMPSKLSTEC